MSETIERVPRTEQEAAASYTRLSKWYDWFGHRSEWPHIAAGLRLLNAQPGERALEVGFGTGHSLVALARAVGPIEKVFGVDLSPGMIAVARRQVCKENVREMVRLNCGSALHLPYATDSFDAVFSSFLLDLIDTPDISIVLDEMRRVLKPGGRLGLVSLSKAGAIDAAVSGVVVKVYERFHRWLPQLIDCRPIYVQKAVESAGLRGEVHHTRSMWSMPVEIVVATK